LVEGLEIGSIVRFSFELGQDRETP